MVNATSRPLNPPRKTRYPLHRRLGWPQGRSGRVRKFLPSPGLEHPTVQPVASRASLHFLYFYFSTLSPCFSLISSFRPFLCSLFISLPLKSLTLSSILFTSVSYCLFLTSVLPSASRSLYVLANSLFNIIPLQATAYNLNRKRR